MKLIQYIGEREHDPNHKLTCDNYRDSWNSGYINADHVERVVVDDHFNRKNKTTTYYVDIFTTNSKTPYIFYSLSKHTETNEDYLKTEEEDKVGLVCARLARALSIPGDEIIIGDKEDYVLCGSNTLPLITTPITHYLYDYETGKEGYL